MSKSAVPHGKFDYRVKTYDKKGRVASNNPYRLVVENGVRKLERPPGSGYWYNEANELLTSPEMEAEKIAKAEALEAKAAAEALNKKDKK